MQAEMVGRFRLVPKALATSSWFIDPELAGRAFSMRVRESRVELSFPDWPGRLIPHSGYHGTLGDSDEGEVLGMAPSFVGAAAIFSLNEKESDQRRQVQAAYDDTVDALIRLRSWVRLGQPWLGVTNVRPSPLEPVSVRLVPSGETIAGPYTGQGGVSVVGGPTFSPQELELMMATASSPPIEHDFMAEARLAIRWAPVKDPARAVLMAAMACEQHARATLLRLCNPAAAQLLETSMRSLRTADLFDSIANAVVGRSLKRDNRDLFRRMQQLLERRNGLAHRGTRVTVDQAKECVTTGDEVFAWLDALTHREGEIDDGLGGEPAS